MCECLPGRVAPVGLAGVEMDFAAHVDGLRRRPLLRAVLEGEPWRAGCAATAHAIRARYRDARVGVVPAVIDIVSRAWFRCRKDQVDGTPPHWANRGSAPSN